MGRRGKSCGKSLSFLGSCLCRESSGREGQSEMLGALRRSQGRGSCLVGKIQRGRGGWAAKLTRWLIIEP